MISARTGFGVVLISLVIASSCATYDPESTASYRHLRPNTPVRVVVRNEMEPFANDELWQIALGVANELPGALVKYLQTSGLEVAQRRSDADRILEVRLEKLGSGMVNPKNSIVATLKGGTRVSGDEAPTDGQTFSAMLTSRTASTTIARRIAQSVVDDSLLVWQPQPSVVERDLEKSRGNPISLLVPEEEQFEPDKPITLRWEAFPSDRLLAGSGISSDRITEVSYEVILRRGYLLSPTVTADDGSRYPPPKELRVDGLAQPHYTLPTIPPYCGRFSWTARAHFRLDGHPRVTEWIQAKSRDPERLRQVVSTGALGIEERVGATDRFKCSTKSGWFSANNYDASGNAARAPTKLKPSAAGDRIAAFVVSSTRCGKDTQQCSAKIHARNTRTFARMITRQLNKFSGSAEAMSGLDVLELIPNPPKAESFAMSLEELQATIRDDRNRLELLERGIRRAVFFYSSADETEYGSFSSGGDQGVGFLQWETHSQLAVNADIVDVASGDKEAELEVLAQAEDTAGIALFLIIPIPYGSDETAFEEGVEQIARPIAFVLEGGRSGWGPEWIDREY